MRSSAYIFFSVHEPLFHAIAKELKNRYGIKKFSGFVWGKDQKRFLEKQDVIYEPLYVFSRDILPKIKIGKPDFVYLKECEEKYEISIYRMVYSERHLLKKMNFQEIMKLVEILFRDIEQSYIKIKPDFIFSEDVSCLTSYIHWVVARKMGIPYYIIGSGKLPYRVSIYTNQFQQWERTDSLFQEVLMKGLTSNEMSEALRFLEEFRKNKKRPSGMDTRSRLHFITKYDITRIINSTKKYFLDRANHTLKNPAGIVGQRFLRLYRFHTANLIKIFDKPVKGEKYVLYPLHFQPEASTLVLAPYYLDQLALIENMAKSLPVGYRLYVKEHFTSQGRRPFSFYKRIKKTFGVRLLGPHEDSWQLIQNASAIAVITGTMGWEALLFEKPVITFGEVFINSFPLVYQAGRVPKDQWYRIFHEAIFRYRPNLELLLKYLWCVLHSTYPGFIGNPSTFPQVMKPENIRNLAYALADAAGLKEKSEIIAVS